MIPKAKRVVVLEIGATKVACVVAQHDRSAAAPMPQGAWQSSWPSAQLGMRSNGSSGYEVLGASVVAYPSLSATWPTNPHLIAQTIDQALEATQAETTHSRVTVVLSHPELAHAQVSASIDLSDEPVPVRARDVERLRQHALSQTLGIDRDALLLEPLGYRGNGFDHVRDPRTLLTTRLHGTFALVSLPRTLRQLIIQAMEAAGFEVDRLVYSAHALAASCTAQTDQEAQTIVDRSMLVEVGGCSTECVLAQGGHLLRSCTVPWGGMHAVEAIATRCRTTRDHALAMSLQGFSSPKSDVIQVWEEQTQALKTALSDLLANEPLPDRALVTGRGALVDGMVEWVQTATGIPATLGRHPRSAHVSEVSQQLALSPALGALALMEQTLPIARPQLSGVVNRLLDRTKLLLTEYF